MIADREHSGVLVRRVVGRHAELAVSVAGWTTWEQRDRPGAAHDGVEVVGWAPGAAEGRCRASSGGLRRWLTATRYDRFCLFERLVHGSGLVVGHEESFDLHPLAEQYAG